MMDIGLMQQLCGLPADTEFNKSDLLAIYEGAMAEQFVGQELKLSGEPELYYGSREARSSTSEVDYIMARDSDVIPIEVKSGTAVRLRSLHLFLKQFPQSPFGIVVSCAPFAEMPGQKLVFVPLYYAFGLRKVK